MAEGAASIFGIVGFGMNLATALQTYMELVREARNELHHIVFDVNATSAALKQLQAIVDADKAVSSATRILSDDGVGEIDMLASSCEKIYQNIALLIQSANRSHPETDKGEGVQRAIDLSSLTSLTFVSRLKWPWLRPRISRCHDQLKWLKVNLLFTLQIANMAQWQINNIKQSNEGTRQADAIHQQVLIRQAADKLRQRQNKIMRRMTEQASLQPEHNDPETMVPMESPSSGGSDTDTSEDEQTQASSYPQQQSHIKKSEPTSMFLSFPSNPSGSSPSTFLLGAQDYEYRVEATKDFAGLRAPDVRRHSFLKPRGLESSSSSSLGRPQERLESRSSVRPTQREQALPRGQQSKAREKNNEDCDMNYSPHVDKFTSSAGSGAMRFDKSQIVLQEIPGYLAKWVDRIFGTQGVQSHRNTDDQLIEAYIAENGGKDIPIKVPFGQSRLHYGLNKVQKNMRKSTWSEYIALSPKKRLAIDKITRTARMTTCHAKTCLALKEYSLIGHRPFFLIFFELEGTQDPITFRDASGREFLFPYETCRKREGMNKLVMDLYTTLSSGDFDLADTHNKIIQPQFWETFLVPGMEITMHLRGGLYAHGDAIRRAATAEAGKTITRGAGTSKDMNSDILRKIRMIRTPRHQYRLEDVSQDSEIQSTGSDISEQMRPEAVPSELGIDGGSFPSLPPALPAYGQMSGGVSDTSPQCITESFADGVKTDSKVGVVTESGNDEIELQVLDFAKESSKAGRDIETWLKYMTNAATWTER